MMETPAIKRIEITNVSFAYNNDRTIVRNVSLSVFGGEFLGLVGPNGSGKTTFAKLLNGSLLPDTGSVFVNGLNTRQVENHLEIKRFVTIIHSDPENQLITPTVLDEITFSLRALNLDEDEILKRSEEALDMFDLQKYRDIHPYFLSIGEQFRVLLAAGLVRLPQVIVLDEVFSMLDSHTRYSITQLLLELRCKYGVSIVLITHRLEDLLNADRIIVMVDGQIMTEGDIDTIFKYANLLKDWKIEIPLYYQLLSNLSPDLLQKLNMRKAL